MKSPQKLDIRGLQRQRLQYSWGLWIWVFAGLFALVLLAVDGCQGLKALAGLGIMVFCVLFLLVQRGWPPIPTLWP